MRQTTIAPAPLPAEVRAPLLDALVAAHEDEPFGPADVRDAARRVVAVADELGIRARVHRGAVDIGGAEVDHVFVVVYERVVDLSLPVRDEAFLSDVRAWVAGDIELADLDQLAARRGFDARVVGEYPSAMRYRGAPFWGQAA